MSILGEFKAFISKGSVMDLAVGVIIGGAFQSIVTSLVKDVITPGIALVSSALFHGGTPDFSQYAIGAKEVLDKNGAPILAAAGHPVLQGGIMHRQFHQQRRQLSHPRRRRLLPHRQADEQAHGHHQQAGRPSTAPPTPEDVLLLREIRDSLKKPATPATP